MISGSSSSTTVPGQHNGVGTWSIRNLGSHPTFPDLFNSARNLPAVVTNLGPEAAFAEALMRDGRLMDQRPYFDADPEWQQVAFPESVEFNTNPEGQMFTSPSTGASYIGIYYNQEMFAEAGIDRFPTTWDEFFAACDALKAAGIRSAHAAVPARRGRLPDRLHRQVAPAAEGDGALWGVLAALERTGHAGDTIVVVTADHGDMLGNHRLFNKGFHMYEETHRVPLLIAGPGIERGAAAAAFANLVDLAPTLLELAAAKPLADADGRSLVPLLAGRTPADWPDDVFAEFHGYETTLYSTRMIRTANWKYVYNPATEDELYDLRSDPGELHNLAGLLAFGHVLRRMKERLVARMRATGDGLAAESAWQANSYDLFLSGRER